jgi:hypothetical protein
LVAVATAVVLTSAAGARRGASAVDRLLARTRPATAVVVANRPGFDWAGVRASPTVEALTTFPAYTSLTIEEAADGLPLTSFVPADTEAMRTIERPVVLAGRRLDPSAPDEAVVTPEFARHTGRGVGDTVTLRLPTPAEAETGLAATDVRPTGPRLRLRIVGVVRSAWYSDEVGGFGSLIPSPGLLAHYRANLLGPADQVPLNALVRLRGGERDIPALRAELARIGPGVDIDVVHRSEAVGHTRTVAAFESACLAAFGLAALLAALALIGPAVIRYAAGHAPVMRTLAVTGLTRSGAMMVTSAGPAAAALIGAVLGVGGAVAASATMPFGVAADREPAPGADVDWLVLGVGFAAVPLLVAATAAVTAWRLLPAGGDPLGAPWGRTAAAGRVGASRPGRSRPVRALTGAGLPVPLALGGGWALGGGRAAGSGRPALFGAVVGVIGILAALSFSAGVADATRHKERFGQSYQLMAIFGFDGQDFTTPGPVLSALADRPEIAGVTNMRVGSGRSGRVSVVTHSYDPVGSPVPLVLTSGSAPASAGDVVLAPVTARELRASIGSTVNLAGDRTTLAVHVRGIGFGIESSTTRYDRGAWVDGATYDALFSGFKEHGGLLRLRRGVDPVLVLPTLTRVATAAAGGRTVLIIPPFAPVQEAEIRDIRVLPIALSAFLILLALAAVGHALALAARVRAHDVAVLRALGLTAGQARATVHIQAALFAASALLVGVPLGLATGRALWRLAAAAMPLRYQPPRPTGTLLLVGPLTVLALAALAAGPARRLARLRVADVLRRD